MSENNRFTALLPQLSVEVAGARAGDTTGQFPILDIIGNLRDEAVKRGGLQPLEKLCADAWERLVTIVESGRPFSTEDIVWLNDLLSRVQALAGTALPPAAAASAAPTVTLPPATAAPVKTDPFAEEAPLNLNLADDTE